MCHTKILATFSIYKVIGALLLNSRLRDKSYYLLFLFLVFSSYCLATGTTEITVPSKVSSTSLKVDSSIKENDIYLDILNSISVSEKRSAQRMKELEGLIKKQENLITELQTELKTQSIHKKNIEELESEISNLADKKESISFVELASIALTSVAVLVTVLGIGVAVLSVWGYNNIKKSTDKIANDVAIKVVNEVATKQVKTDIPDIVKNQLSDMIKEGKLNNSLESVVDMIMRNNKAKKESVDLELFAELDEPEES